MSETVAYGVRDEVAVITISNPPVNALNVDARFGLMEALTRVTEDPSVRAILVTGGPKVFIGGADVKNLGGGRVAPSIGAIGEAYEGNGKPAVAAIAGYALGGGFEFALACHFRIGNSTTIVGTPEIDVGLIPSGGGTRRLPRLVGLDTALDLIMSARHVDANEALCLGLIDRLVEGDLLSEAIGFAKAAARSDKPFPCTSTMSDKLEPPDRQSKIIEKYRTRVAKRSRGEIAPQRAIDSVVKWIERSHDEAVDFDMESHHELTNGDQGKALRYLFFAEREARKIPGISKVTEIRNIASVGVIGAGTMGGGIAMACADAGYPIVIVDVAEEALKKGMDRVEANYQRSVDRGSLHAEEMQQRLGRIRATMDYASLSSVDLVIEAAVEDEAIKKEIFKQLDSLCKKGAILATNTSGLDINAIADATKRPGDVLGLHFFAPANVMKLLEVVRGDRTAPDVLAASMKFARAIGKVGVVAGVCPGFVANRSRRPMITESVFILEDGATPEQVDRVLKKFGMPMGIFATLDLSGVGLAWRRLRAEDATRTVQDRYSHIVDELYERKRLGQKTGAGFYKYETGERTPIPDPEVEEIIKASAKRQGVDRRQLSDEEVLARCLYVCINEAANIVGEGMAVRPSDVDVMWVYGFAFPRYRGGILHYANSIGLDRVLSEIRKNCEARGRYWKPSPFLERMVAEGKTFHDLSAS